MERRVTEDRLSLDRVHDLLAARHRRCVLYCLYLYGNQMRLLDVAKRIAEWEYGVPEDEPLDICNSLYHRHVPKLADANAVTYSQSEDAIELAQNAAQLRPYLERAAETDLDVTDLPGL